MHGFDQCPRAVACGNNFGNRAGLHLLPDSVILVFVSLVFHAGARMPIGHRIQVRLNEIGQTPAWLAERAGVQRSTISRILSGERNPTPQTLQELAPVLGTTVGQLVLGTDAEERVKEAEDLVARRDYEAAVSQVIEYERRARDLATRVRELEDDVHRERERATAARVQLNEMVERAERARREADSARRTAESHEGDARRYRAALEKAVADVARLREQLRELGSEVGAGKTSAQVAAILAGVAAAVSVASYLGNDTKGDNDSSSKKAPRTRAKRSKPI